jgi:hypothetical protein
MELPGAIATAPAQSPDVTVQFGLDPPELGGEAGAVRQIGAQTILLRVPQLARFLITGGKSITVALEDGVTARDASVFVLGSSFGALLHQRGALVLHAAAVARNGRAVAICGPSGAGKSTLAAALCQAGCSFVTDDLCVVSLDAKRGPAVLPDGRQLKLWRQSIEGLALDDRQGEAVYKAQDKYFVAPDAVEAEPPCLSAIYVLQESQREEAFEKLGLAEAMKMLAEQSYRPELRHLMGSAPHILTQGAALFRNAGVFRLSRPRHFEHVAETVAALLWHWDGLH